MARKLLGVIALLIVSHLVVGCTINASLFGDRFSELTEVTIEKEGEAKALLISIEGPITSEESRSTFGGTSNTVDEVRRQLKKAAEKDSKIKAVILRINSPGGGATASDTIYNDLKRFKEETKIPVVAYFQDVAASGGYYVAMAADEIVAQPTTITGSIGVIGVMVDAVGMMEKIGVKAHVVRSSQYKASGHPLIEKSAEDLKQIRAIIDQMYNQFVTVVAAGRPKLTKEAIAKLADGQVHMGGPAKDAGLVDHVGYFEMARERAAALADVKQIKIVTYSTWGDPGRTEYTSPTVTAPDSPISLDFDLASKLGLTNGASRFLYYWAP